MCLLRHCTVYYKRIIEAHPQRFSFCQIKAWEEMDPEDRQTNFLPKKYVFTPCYEACDGTTKLLSSFKIPFLKFFFLASRYSSLRLVPGYKNFIQERFERCLDLYLCPRQRKMRVTTQVGHTKNAVNVNIFLLFFYLAQCESRRSYS